MFGPNETCRDGVLLVNMPYAGIKHPSLALGVLHALLEGAGVSVRSYYANLDFAGTYSEHVGGLHILAANNTYFRETLCRSAFFPDEPKITDICAALSLSASSQLQKNFEILSECSTEFITETARRIVAAAPAVVGCTSLLAQHLPSLLLLKKIKEAAPEITTLLGGAGLDSEMGVTNHRLFSFVDYIVSGDADGVIVPLCRDLLRNKTATRHVASMAGVLTPQHRLTGYPSPAERLFFDDLDSLPPPNYEDYFSLLRSHPVLKDKVMPTLLYESSRGCGWGQTGGCHFCGLSGKSHCYRKKSPEKILADLKFLSEKYDVTFVEMTDNMMPPEYEKTLLPQLAAADAPYQLFYETRPVARKEYYQTMRQAGVRGVQPGLENISTPLLTYMNKGIQSWQAVQSLKWCRQNGFWTSWLLMWNFPEEKPEWYQPMTDIMPHLFHLQPPGGLNRMNFCRFSTFWQRYKDQWTLEPDADHRYTFVFDRQTQNDLSYRFFRENEMASNLMELSISGNYVSEIAQFLLYWLGRFKSGQLDKRPSPILLAERNDGGMTIRDTRPEIMKIPVGDFTMIRFFPAEKEIFLNKEEAAMILDCDDAPLEKDFLTKWGETGKQFLQQYRENHFFEFLDDRIVSLLLYAPLPPVPKYGELPFGTIAETEIPKE